jgi:hypothetical protein
MYWNNGPSLGRNALALRFARKLVLGDSTLEKPEPPPADHLRALGERRARA